MLRNLKMHTKRGYRKNFRKKIEKSDILVLATPVYFDTISRQLKTFIDKSFSR